MENRLTFIRYTGRKTPSNNKYALYRCICGNEKEIVETNVKTNRTRSCGCLIKNNGQNGKDAWFKHGLCDTKKYKTWESIKSRCLNPNNVSYPNYGARGIKMCDKWLKFSGFDEDMPDPPTNKHSIDRVDNNGDYCKENCRWVTKHEQDRNKRTNRIIEFNGKQQLLTDWAKDLDISVSALTKRLKIWSLEKALTTLVNKEKVHDGNKNHRV